MRAARDQSLHQDHQEPNVLAILLHCLVIAETDIFRNRLVEMPLQLVFVFPTNGDEFGQPR